MEDDLELGMKSDPIEGSEGNLRVLRDGGVGSIGDGSVESVAGNEVGASSSMDIDTNTVERGGYDDRVARVSDNERSEDIDNTAERMGFDDGIARVSYNEISRSMDTNSAERGGYDDGIARVVDNERSEKTVDDATEDKEPRCCDISEDRADSPNEKINPNPEVDNRVSNREPDESGTEADRNVRMELKEENQGDGSGNCAVSDYKSLLSEFDDYVASEKTGSGISRALSYGFELGDLVWGKVKSHPWWPGHIFNEAFATPSVRRTRRIGHVLVAFFGDSSYGWFDPAELIPFEPHFAEKSQQTNSKHFMSAVEDAVDEAGRRSALGLVCKCRNPYNFRPTSVRGYFAIDVPDYEAQVVYSIEQIKNAKDKFRPIEILSFVKQLAIEPQKRYSDNLNFVKKKAAVSALRGVVFEEFDETYAQAFGTKSNRPSMNALEPSSKEPPRAPLSGPLVIAETLGDPKISLRLVKSDDSSITTQSGKIQASSGASQVQGLYGSGLKLSPDGDKGLAQTLSEGTIEKKAQISGHGDLKQMVSSSSSHKSPTNGKNTGGGVIKKIKVPKRSLEAMGSENAYPEMKKTKKKKTESVSSRPGSAQSEEKQNHPKRDSEKVIVSYADIKLPQLLRHLHALALDPFFGSSERTSFGAVKQFFFLFRSRNYQKSLTNVSCPPSEATENAHDTRPSKPFKMRLRINDPSKVGEKRILSDRQEEIPSAKKMKKADQLKLTTSKEKTRQVKSAKAPQPVKKTAPSPAKVVKPTMLVMKFPPGTSLPTMAFLKARFGRFGMLDQSAMRVFLKTSTCRVVFVHKTDAVTAFKYVTGNNSLFGNVSVRYFLRDVEPPVTEPPEPRKGKADEPVREPQNERAGPAPYPTHQPVLQPSSAVQKKSCLKKPGSDDGGGSRGTARVKYILATVPGYNRNGGNGPSSSTSSSVGMEYVVSKSFQKGVASVPASTLPPILPLPKQCAKAHRVDDISQQMMSLLSRCNDVVTNVTGLLGYVPYHPL